MNEATQASFERELAEIEKYASTAQVRALRAGLDATERAYSAGKNALGLKRFLTPEGRAWRSGAKANLRQARVNFSEGLRNVRSEALANASRLGPDAAEHAATLRAADLAKNRFGRKGLPVPEGFSPGEQAQQAQSAAAQGFRRKLGLGGAVAGGAGLYLATRPRQDPYGG